VQQVEESADEIILTPREGLSLITSPSVASSECVDFTFDECLNDGFSSPQNSESSLEDRKSIDELFEEIREFVEAKELSTPEQKVDWQMETLESFESLLQDQNESKLLSSASPFFDQITVSDCYPEPKIELHSFYDSDYDSMSSPESDHSGSTSPVGLDLFPGLF